MVDYLSNYDAREDRSTRVSTPRGLGIVPDLAPQSITCTRPEELHKIIKHGILSRRKAGHTDSSGSLIFKFTLQTGKPTVDSQFPSLSLVELSSGALVGGVQKSRVKKTTEVPWALRVVEAAYDGSLVRSIVRILSPTSKSAFCFLFNHAQIETQASDSLLQLSQIIMEGEPSPSLSSVAAKEKVSSGIKLILSKKSAKKSDQKKAGDKTSSRLEENPRRKELFR